jgi:uncharacterized membrane protein
LNWQAPQQPAWGGPQAESSGKATASLVLGICGLVVCPIILSIVGLVLGYQARGEIQRSGGRISGESQAKAGIILGWVGIVLYGIGMLLFFALLAGSGVDSGDFEGDFSLLIPR